MPFYCLCISLKIYVTHLEILNGSVIQTRNLAKQLFLLQSEILTTKLAEGKLALPGCSASSSIIVEVHPMFTESE